MIYIIGIIAIIGIIGLIISLTIKTYNKEQQEQDERILQVEKRLQRNIADRKVDIINFYDKINVNNDEIREILIRLQKLERIDKKTKRCRDDV